jgi:Rho-type GTPase-activating protein 1/2
MSALCSPSNNIETHLSRSLTVRLNNLRTQYQNELAPLTEQLEALTREITELKAMRDLFLEETTVLNARNEELAKLSAQYARRMDVMAAAVGHHNHNHKPDASVSVSKKSVSLDKSRPSQQSLSHPYPPQPSQQLMLSASRTSSYSDETVDSSKYVKIQKHETPEFPTPSSKRNFMKWPGSKAKEVVSPPAAAAAAVGAGDGGKGKGGFEHVFQQVSLLRFTRCDHCGEKMWGSQVRCTREWGTPFHLV